MSIPSQLRTLLTLACIVAMSSCLSAQDEAKGKKKKNNRQKQATNQMMRGFNKLDLTDEQKKEMQAVIKENYSKIVEAQKKVDGVLSPEQRKARKDAWAKAKKEGVKGRKATEMVNKELGLTEEKMKEYNDAQKAMNGVRAEIRKLLMAKLTDEQRASMQKGKKGKGKGKAKGKKKKDDASEQSADK